MHKRSPQQIRPTQHPMVNVNPSPYTPNPKLIPPEKHNYKAVPVLQLVSSCTTGPNSPSRASSTCPKSSSANTNNSPLAHLCRAFLLSSHRYRKLARLQNNPSIWRLRRAATSRRSTSRPTTWRVSLVCSVKRGGYWEMTSA